MSRRWLVATVVLVVVAASLWMLRREICGNYFEYVMRTARSADEAGKDRFTIKGPPWGCKPIERFVS